MRPSQQRFGTNIRLQTQEIVFLVLIFHHHPFYRNMSKFKDISDCRPKKTILGQNCVCLSSKKFSWPLRLSLYVIIGQHYAKI